MKISKSKQELASIISENGGWRDGTEWASQNRNGEVGSFDKKPILKAGSTKFSHGGGHEYCAIARTKTIRNWHQTILSREEYFHLHPAPDDGDSLSAALGLITDEKKHEHVDCKPTIEQLVADYRNHKDYADRKQREADAAKADSDAKLKELDMASRYLGFSVVPITSKQELEMVITDWRDLRKGDEMECVEPSDSGLESGSVGVIVNIYDSAMYLDFPDYEFYGYYNCPRSHFERGYVRFIRRP